MQQTTSLLGYGPDDYQNYSSYSGYEQSQGGYDHDYYMQPASNCPYTNVALPAHQPTATSTVCRGKLFFVTAPDPVSKDVLFDVFSRFADLIEIQVVQGTVYGYIKYGIKESADAAKILLDGATVAGNTIRLTYPEYGNDAKRIKLDR